MSKTYNLKNDLEKILPTLLRKIKKEIKIEDSNNEQIKRIQAYTKLLEQINKLLKVIEQEVDLEFSEQDTRIMENYLTFNTEENSFKTKKNQTTVD